MLRADVFGLIPALVIILIVSGAFYVQTNRSKFQQTSLNPSPSPVLVSPSPSLSPSLVPTPKSSANVSININNNTNENSNNSDGAGSIDINQFKYPGVSVGSSSPNQLSLTSPDDSDKITDWYKERIRSVGMNTKSFISTKTNGNVENKLVGTDGENEVTVDIKKGTSESLVKITVSIP